MSNPVVIGVPAAAGCRVFLCTTPDELAGQRDAAAAMLRGSGWEVIARGPTDGAVSVEEVLAPIDAADVVLALVGWRRGPVPDPEIGGGGRRPWVQWEVSRALRRGQPVLVLMASDAWRAREEEPEARAVIADFRAELKPLAALFDPGPDATPRFEKLLRGEIDRYRESLARTGSAPHSRPASKPAGGLILRRWPEPELPAHPWPLFLPYSHPAHFAGRDRELLELTGRLGQPPPVMGLYAASGAGKSSLLLAGLVPVLRAAGRAVALDRHPEQPGLAGRLVADLLEGSADLLALDEDDHATFVDRLILARRRALDTPPVLVLDQFEEVLRGDRRVRAVVGTLLAATAQRRPGVTGAPCRWLLAYRWEVHGELVHWLTDPLREARALGFAGAQDLPHDLASADRFHAWALPPFATPPPGAIDVAGAAGAVFHDAITAPLRLRDADGAPRYPWRFEGDGAERLARAFGEARALQPEAQLVPELQVVLAHLVDRAGEPVAGREAVLVVPDDPGRLIDEALESHLGRALDLAFPTTDRIGRTRALLALRELADADGQRGRARAGEALAKTIGREGRDVLEKLQAPGVRLVVAEREGDDVGYVLSHDRLAELIVRATDGEAAGGRLTLDPDLLTLRRFVVLQTELFLSGDRRQAMEVPARRAAGIEAHADTLLADDDRRRWWQACLARRQADRRRRVLVTAIASAVLVLGGALTWTRVTQRAARRAVLEQIARGEPGAALGALARGLHDPAMSREDLLDRLRERKPPFEVLDAGLGGVAASARGTVVLEVGEMMLPLLGNALEDPAPLASLLWAIDFAAAPDRQQAGRAADLKARALAPLFRLRLPPPADGAGWVSIPAGTFLMGAGPGEKGDDDEYPAHRVTLGAFRALDHEVTNAEYRRLHPDHPGEDDRPAGGVSWYAAYVYASWVGGRLPTEAEWEYMARAGCRFEHCREDGAAAAVPEVAWVQTSAQATSGAPENGQPVRRLRANPWGMYDMFGNVLEWTADRLAPYGAEPQANPWSPVGARRGLRGGSLWLWGSATRPANRLGGVAGSTGKDQGFRPVIPAALAIAPAIAPATASGSVERR